MTPDTRSTLTAARDAGAPVHLIALSQELRVKGGLVALDDDLLTVEIGPDQPLTLRQTVHGSFSLAHRTWSFLSTVLDLEGPNVYLAAPGELLWADRRITSRIPVTVPVQVELLGAHPESRPMLVDLALAGMKVSVRRATGLSLEERIPIVLEYEGRRVELVGELRRIEGNNLGFFFPDSIRRGRISPPPELGALLERLIRG